MSALSYLPSFQTLKSYRAHVHTKNLKPLITMSGHKGCVTACVFSPDALFIASSSLDGSVRLWDSKTGDELKQFKGHEGGAWDVAFSPDNTLIASAGNDASVKIWNAKGMIERDLEGHKSAVYCVAFSPYSECVASGGQDKIILIHNVDTGMLLKKLEGHTDAVFSVCFFHNNRTLASGGSDNTARVWLQESGQVVTSIAHLRMVRAVCVSPDDRQVASAGDSSDVKIWDALNGQTLHTLRGHTDYVYGLDFCPDGTMLASGSTDKTVRIWDSLDGTCVRIINAHESWIYAVAFSPDGSLVVSASHDATMCAWSPFPDYNAVDSLKRQLNMAKERAHMAENRHREAVMQVTTVRSDSLKYMSDLRTALKRESSLSSEVEFLRDELESVRLAASEADKKLEEAEQKAAEMRFEQKRTQVEVRKTGALQRFHYKDLCAATNQFDASLIVGEGGFGSVFSGVINGIELAIKRTPRIGDFNAEYEREIDVLCTYPIRHDNLVPLVGYADDDDSYLCLVYKLMCFGSLQDRLACVDGTPPLPARRRILVAVDAARGLTFLHSEADPPVIHRDVKSANIMLDRGLVGKIGDFGLARVSPELLDTRSHVSTRAFGTMGYIDPEYTESGIISAKSDVWSFGVVLLELLTGKLPIDRSEAVPNLHKRLESKLDSEQDVMSVCDRAAGWDPCLAFAFACVARQCLRRESAHRPSMAEVQHMLEELANAYGCVPGNLDMDPEDTL
eukprot:Rmarinus@m.17370